MNISIENGKTHNQTTMGERLKRIGEASSVDETCCFRLGFNEKMERRFRTTASDMGAVQRED